MGLETSGVSKLLEPLETWHTTAGATAELLAIDHPDGGRLREGLIEEGRFPPNFQVLRAVLGKPVASGGLARHTRRFLASTETKGRAPGFNH